MSCLKLPAVIFVLNEEHSGSKKTFSGIGRPGLVGAQRRSCGRAFSAQSHRGV